MKGLSPRVRWTIAWRWGLVVGGAWGLVECLILWAHSQPWVLNISWTPMLSLPLWLEIPAGVLLVSCAALITGLIENEQRPWFAIPAWVALFVSLLGSAALIQLFDPLASLVCMMVTIPLVAVVTVAIFAIGAFLGACERSEKVQQVRVRFCHFMTAS